MSKTTLTAFPGMHDLTFTRTFDAPIERVFKAFIDPDSVAKWWGTRDSTTIIDKLDPKQGGIWRFISKDSAGNEYAFHGVYHAVIPNDRLVYTFEFEGMPGHVLLETIIFEEHDGKTLVSDMSVFQTVEARDGMLENGMEEGANESFDQMEELLAGQK